MSKRATLISGILISSFLVVSSALNAQVANTKTLIVNGGGDKGTKDFGTIEDGATAELIVKTTNCKSLTGSIDKGDKDGWRGGGSGKSINFTFDSTKVDSGKHPGEFSGSVKGCPGGDGNNTWSVSVDIRVKKVTCKLTIEENSKKLCPGGEVELTASSKNNKSCKLSQTNWTITNNQNVVVGSDRNQTGKTITIQSKEDEVGEFTVEAENDCCQSDQIDIEVAPKVTKFTANDFPKCVECGVDKKDFTIQTDPLGNEDLVEVDIPSQGVGTHKATAVGCKEGVSEEYTLKGPNDGYFHFKGSLSETSQSSDKDSDRFVDEVTRLTKTEVKLRVTVIGKPKWKNLKQRTLNPGNEFSYSRQLTKTEEFNASGGVDLTIKGVGLSFQLGYKVATSTSLSETRSVKEQCECTQTGCKFRFTSYQQVVSPIKDVLYFERTYKKTGPNEDPPSEEEVPFQLNKNESQDLSGFLPTQGLKPFDNLTEKKCLNSSGSSNGY